MMCMPVFCDVTVIVKRDWMCNTACSLAVAFGANGPAYRSFCIVIHLKLKQS